MLGMLGHTLVAFIDNVMVGQLGTAELAAVSLGNSIFYVPMSLAVGFTTAITTLVAEADAANQKSRVRSILKHGVIVCLVLGVLMSLAIVFSRSIVDHMGQDQQVVEIAKPYIYIIGISIFPLVLFQAFKQFSDGISRTMLPMLASLLANVLNVFFNYVLIFGNLGAPKLGVEGAAIGTLIARIVAVLILVLILYKLDATNYYLTGWKWKEYSKKLFKKLSALGIPSAMQMFFEVLIFTAAIWLSGMLGKNPQAANQIALNLATMTFMVAVGLSVAATIRVGNQKGFQEYIELRRIAYSIFLMIFILECFFALGFILGKNWLPTLYMDQHDPANMKDNLAVLKTASQLLIVAAVFQISDGIQVTVLGALRGLQDVNKPTLITMVSYWVIGFPTCWYLGLKTDLGAFGIWIGLGVALTINSILLLWRFNYISLKYIRKYTL